ncbi:MAG: hypothetical protein ACI849_001210 [Patiriisocius sp.]|jgi:hypothetical protein
MKAIFLILGFFLGVGLLTRCNNDDDTTQQEYSINGVWNLKNVNGSFLPTNIDYNVGDVIWTFNETSSILFVENNILTTGPEDIYAGLDTGSYNYKIQLDGDAQVLVIDDTERGFLVLSPNTLKIDDRALDGFIMEFEK